MRTTIYLATWTLEPNQGHTLTRANYPYRLLSYFFLKDEQEEHILEYFKTGQNIEHTRRSSDAKETE
jgi:hypothetical protein